VSSGSGAEEGERRKGDEKNDDECLERTEKNDILRKAARGICKSRQNWEADKGQFPERTAILQIAG
jgi:hypothetical protein